MKINRVSRVRVKGTCGLDVRPYWRYPVALVTAAGLVMVSGCGMNSNPLANYNEDIQKGIPPHEKIQPKPIPKEALVVDSAEYFVFNEGIEAGFTIKGRVLIEGVSHRLDFVEGMPKTASYNPETGKLVWRPEVGFIKDTSATRTSFPLKIRLTAESNPVTTITKTVYVIVEKYFFVPEIVSVTDVPGPLVEGRSASIEVHVKAPDSINNPPKLFFLPPKSGLDASNLLTLNGQPKLVGEEFVYQVRIDTQRAADPLGLTKSESEYRFNLQVISQFGVPSDLYEGDVRIRNQIQAPVSTLEKWTNEPELKSGQMHEIHFNVVDPRREGEVEVRAVTDLSSLPGAPGLNCKWIQGDNRNCVLKWLVPASLPANQEVAIELELINKDSYSFATSKAPHYFRLVKGGTRQ